MSGLEIKDTQPSESSGPTYRLSQIIGANLLKQNLLICAINNRAALKSWRRGQNFNAACFKIKNSNLSFSGFLRDICFADCDDKFILSKKVCA